jgi:hypothetical protein
VFRSHHRRTFHAGCSGPPLPSGLAIAFALRAGSGLLRLDVAGVRRS